MLHRLVIVERLGVRLLHHVAAVREHARHGQLLPATATVIGVVVLAQLPSLRDRAGVALVVAGVALHRDGDRALKRHDPDQSIRVVESVS